MLKVIHPTRLAITQRKQKEKGEKYQQYNDDLVYLKKKVNIKISIHKYIYLENFKSRSEF